ncbi:MAG: hypothetical protein M1831_000439 [Alyxoria varia]|nr:MAG: hypothetical protein M1831_000439 [Alyxoria varia]
MGRRKIEIKAIKDDRNRSVTFLKRKHGLFKKAHELSVLCSVDVAVIVFGQNKKLYEYSSGDINQTLARYQYFGVPHEHKGPNDFADKGGGDDDEDDDDNIPSDQPDNPSPPHHGVVPQHPGLPAQPNFQQVRHGTPSASPPVPNGMYQHRMGTPPQPGSRPASRTHVRRQSSNLVPENHPRAQASQSMGPSRGGYPPYPSNNAFYHQQQAAHHGMHPPHPQGTPPMSQHHYTHPPGPQHQMQHLYLQEQQQQQQQQQQQRRAMPANMAVHGQQEQNPQHLQTPRGPSRPFQSPPPPGTQGATQGHVRAQGPYAPPRQPQPDQRQMMANQQWDQRQQQEAAYRGMNRRRDSVSRRSESIDVESSVRKQSDGGHQQQPQAQRYGGPSALPSPKPPPRNSSTSGTPSMASPGRVNSVASDAKRPRLTVQIPGEGSDDNEATADGESSSTSNNNKTSQRGGAGDSTSKTSAATPARAGATESSHSSGIVLPAPSPRSASAGAILSAGATGPTNPFARPNLPAKQNSSTSIPGVGGPTSNNTGGITSGSNNTSSNSGPDSSRDNIASPMSALPSRVMGGDGNYMSSPSSMFPELGWGSHGGSNNLASPAIYQPTPVATHGPSWRDPAPPPTSDTKVGGGEAGEKRKEIDGEGSGSQVSHKRARP